MTSLPYFIFCLGAAVYRDHLYTIGGWRGVMRDNTMEVYCPITDTWSLCPIRLNQHRSNYGLVVVSRARIWPRSWHQHSSSKPDT
ncbi:unnamed protein product [Protopolystoma xenopodis]|uniref:Uncharacterized protein n=1 Tax=Protopolystoma xenopodis TaxID=117903 RepID=A0A3S5CNK2_9PLAT|nr:unnamed protein product [Protopolystoma xenopodis]